MLESQAPDRSLENVTDDELLTAVIKMAKELKIPVKSSHYNLYETLLHERDRAVKWVQQYDDTTD